MVRFINWEEYQGARDGDDEELSASEAVSAICALPASGATTTAGNEDVASPN